MMSRKNITNLIKVMVVVIIMMLLMFVYSFTLNLEDNTQEIENKLNSFFFFL